MPATSLFMQKSFPHPASSVGLVKEPSLAVRLHSGPMGHAPSTPQAHRLLLVEDDVGLAHGIQQNLASEGFEILVAGHGEGALALLEVERADLIVLDLMLPGMNGFEVLQTLRGRGNATPVLILSARSEATDRLSGLSFGADDYLTKPFSMLELTARIRAILRRAQPQSLPARILKSGPFLINTLLMTVHRGRTSLDVSTREFRLLQVLITHAGRIHSRRELINMAWEKDARPTPRAVDAHIAALRRKLGDSERTPCIQTVEREGYRWLLPVQPAR